ncbi:MAG TPA: threonine ammonia-lyase [Fimbriimonas sp.]|nr:threonine ammonia-lyase [Fimbriimonas sp.]
MPEDITYDRIVEAHERLRGGVLVTPCRESMVFSGLTGASIFCKAEYLQRTGSFKERGARNALLLLSKEQMRRGVVAASAGNHALALAYHGRDLGIPVTVVMPVFAPLVKQSGCRALGAEVLLSGQNIGEAKTLADVMVREKGLTYIHGFDGADVIAGQGTLGLEILAQVPDVDVIVAPVGGAGLIAGVGLAVKTTHKHVRIVGVESHNAASFAEAIKAGHPVSTNLKPTLADGLAVPQVGSHAFEIAKRVVDDVVQVDEEQVAIAILRLLEIEKGVVEGAGATPLAAILGPGLPGIEGKKVVLCLCGGNIDPAILGRVIEHGLVADGRLAQFRAIISDRPGGLARFCEVIAGVGASVKQIVHERAFTSADVSAVEVNCIVETRNRKHVDELMAALTDAGLTCRRDDRSFGERLSLKHRVGP